MKTNRCDPLQVAHLSAHGSKTPPNGRAEQPEAMRNLASRMLWKLEISRCAQDDTPAGFSGGPCAARGLHSGGFSLLELMVAMGIFLLVSATAFTLFNRQQTNNLQQKGLTGLNVELRNAVSMMQLDVATAGSGYYQEPNVPSWPVGVTIQNNVVPVGSSCYDSATSTYGPNCFDALNVIVVANPAQYPPVNASDSTGGSGAGNCSYTCNSTIPGTICNQTSGTTVTAYTQPAVTYQLVAGVVTPVHWTLQQTAAEFKTGDQLVFVTSGTTKSTQMTTAVLTANGAVSGSAVALTFNSTNVDGTNTSSHDPLDITACGGHPCQSTTRLGTQFCGNDWILKLAPPIIYSVDSSTPTDPKLLRTQNNQSQVVMDQVIGFKVGASILNDPSPYPEYIYDTCAYALIPPPPGTQYNCSNLGDQAFNFTMVRAVRVSLIGRTPPDPTSTFHNSFDQGLYQVQGAAIIINLRNMSMND